MIQPMEITLIEKSGKRHELTLPDIEPVTCDWLNELCAKFFSGKTYQKEQNGTKTLVSEAGRTLRS
jgi:phage regulator Rha-like protein